MLSKNAWRSVSEHESIEIERAIRARSRLDRGEKAEVKPPAAARATIAGAAWWAIACQWQDRREIFVLCSLMLAWQIFSSLYSLAGIIIK